MTDSRAARLLIVDDEAAHLQALCDTLEDQGYVAVGSRHPQTALRLLQQEPFDLLLADLAMPGMDGITLLRAALEIDPMLVGIIMTGEGTIGSAVEAMRSGAMDYVLKPFKLSAILPVLTRGLAMRRLRVDNSALQVRLQEQMARLEAANHELDAFTRSASHDLRSPLNAVQGLATLLTSRVGPQLPAEERGWLLQIERSARQMTQLIDDLMRLSRLGRKALNLQPVDIGELARAVAAELRAQEPQRDIAWQVADELPTALADEALLRQALLNLMSNALKFTRGRSRAEIEVGCEWRGGEGALFVRDNGVGFDMARAGRMFAPFERLHRPDEFEGTGVGLSIVQRIVQRHGGRIWAETSPGDGATFYFTLAAERLPNTMTGPLE